jgi:hypothetical protein
MKRGRLWCFTMDFVKNKVIRITGIEKEWYRAGRAVEERKVTGKMRQKRRKKGRSGATNAWARD